MDMYMNIDNPTVLGFAVDSFTYNLYMEDYLLFSSTHPQKIVFEGGDTSQVVLPVTMFNDSLTFVTDSLKKAGIDTATYRIEGMFYADVPFNDNREFEYDQSFDAPAYPDSRNQYQRLGFCRAGRWKCPLGFLPWEIVNFNLFPYEFKRI